MTYDIAHCSVAGTILDPKGNNIGTASPVAISLQPIDNGVASFSIKAQSPELWSIDNPVLHTLVVEVSIDGAVVDRYEQNFGFRYVKFDASSGFSLNGVSLKLKGVCCHQDSAGVGVAVPPALQEWRIRVLKSMGVNAIRTSHNPPDPALLDACDRLGMMIMDELRSPGACDELLGQFESMVRRDRNHPAVILWSLGNEELSIQKKESGVNIWRRMQHLAHKLDPNRPTTYAMNGDWLNIADFHVENGFRFDVYGGNYRCIHDGKSPLEQNLRCYDDFHERHPDWPLIGSETAGVPYTRGLYEPNKSNIPLTYYDTHPEFGPFWSDDKFKYIVSPYGNIRALWADSIEQCWQDCANRPCMAGTFLWTGFDFRGDTWPFLWPAVLAHFGLVDLCGFYKEIGHYIRSWWRPETPHIFLMPHWNWEGREGELIDVWCYCNAAEVELFCNGHSLGRKAMPKNFRLEWKVPYESGMLQAKGSDAAGKLIIETTRRTAKAPAAIRLSSDFGTIDNGDGTGILVVNAAIVDKNGELCPRADNEVTFDVGEGAQIIGVGNGNPMSHEPDKFTNRRMAYHGLCQVIVKCKKGGNFCVKARGIGLVDGEFATAP
jgi:beta-galactosidase